MRLAFALVVGLLLSVSTAHAAAPKPGSAQHRVVKGDTISAIARANGVSVDDLRRWNDLDSDVIRLGATLRVGPAGKPYKIRRGETLGRIAAGLDVPMSAIVALNPGLRPNRIRSGQTIFVPKPAIAPPPRKQPLACPGRIVQIASHRAYRVRNKHLAWATASTADALRRGFSLIKARHGTSIRARVLDASSRGGGRLGGHRSHRTGRDVDITYFQSRCGPAGCPVEKVGPKELDVARQWSLFRYWLDNDDVEMLFVDYALQKPLYEHAKKKGATRKQLDRWFQYPRPAYEPHGVIRHWQGHKNHVHARFHDAECRDRCCSQPALAQKKPRSAARAKPRQRAKPLGVSTRQRREPRKLASKRRPAGL
jgi:LysM repeat protein